jgi:FKBP-type peptidyl-prolyl cis-trans isomerase FklB
MTKRFSSSIYNIFVLTLTLAALTISPTNAGSNPASQKFLDENSQKPNVVTLPSGLQYKILRTGNGLDHPEFDSPTKCHYRGTLIDGITEFDSSYKRGEPAMFQPRQVIKGWTEAMQLMVEGDKWELYIPSELAYGDNGSPGGSGDIKGGDALIFTMEMIEIVGTSVPDKFEVRCNVKSMERCNEKETKYVAAAESRFGSDVDKLNAEIERIKRISDKGSDKVIDWCNRRIRILNQLNKSMADGKEDEEEL